MFMKFINLTFLTIFSSFRIDEEKELQHEDWERLSGPGLNLFLKSLSFTDYKR